MLQIQSKQDVNQVHYLLVWMVLNIFHRVSFLSYAMLVPINMSWAFLLQVVEIKLLQINMQVKYKAKIRNKKFSNCQINRTIQELLSNTVRRPHIHVATGSGSKDLILIRRGEDRRFATMRSYKVLVFELRMTYSIDYNMTYFTIGLKHLPEPSSTTMNTV